MPFDPEDERIASFLHEHYGLKGTLSLLPGENRNLLVETSEGRRYVLKLAEFRESRNGFELERLAVEALASAGLDQLGLPDLVPTLDGAASADLVFDELTFNGRLLRYVPGTMWAEAGHRSKALRQELGRFVARLSHALATVESSLASRTHRWDPTRCSALRTNVAGIEDRAKQRILDRAFLLFEASVHRFESLPHSLIHSDVNEGNVLVAGGRVCGLLDFDDCLYNPTVCELAVCLAYLLLDEDDPLVAGAEIVAAYHEIRPLSSAELEVLFPVMCGRLAVSLAISSERLRIDPSREAWFTTAAPAWKALESYVDIDPITAAETLATGTGVTVFGDRSAPPAGVSERREEVISGALALSFERPLKISRGRAQFLFDDLERPYLDLYNNVCHVGHCHPRVVAAGAAQMARLNTNTRYLYDQLVEYGERLCATMPDRLNHCFVLNSGTEANELAVRLARTFTGRKDMIVLEGAYHGHTSTMIDISPYKFLGKGGSKQAEPWVHVAPIPDGYRGPHRGQGSDAGKAYGDDVGEIIDGLERPLAAFMCESLPSCGGQIIPPDEYLATVYAHVRAAGGVCIADEVQVGFGRIGSHFWGFEQQEVVPDIVVMGKPIGNGHPLAAVVTTSEIARAFADNGMEFFSTFGGNPVSCAIGMAVMDVIRDQGLQENARDVGTYLRNELRGLMQRHQLIGDVRGEGLFIGIELVRNRETLEPATEEAAAVVNALREHHVLTGTDGLFDNVIKIKPPLVVTVEDADMAVRILDDVLTSLST